MVAGPNAKFSTPGAAVGLFCHTPGIPLARYDFLKVFLATFYRVHVLYNSGEFHELFQVICCSQGFQLVREEIKAFDRKIPQSCTVMR